MFWSESHLQGLVVGAGMTKREELFGLVKTQARSKLPKKRRRVLPVEQPRRKRDASASNRRVNAVKHPVVLKELSPGSNKFGVNGMNMISLALQGPPNLLRPPAANPLPLQARAPTVESPIINTQSAAISLASLQPPLMTAPPLQPRPATTGALDLMLPLQPKLLPGFNLQSSFLSNTLSTVRPPDIREVDETKLDNNNGLNTEFNNDKDNIQMDDLKGDDNEKDYVSHTSEDKEDYNPTIEVIVEKESVSESSVEKTCDSERDSSNLIDNESSNEINSNVIEVKIDSVVSNDDSPNNNSY